jgi:hypothetical protein
VGDADEVMAVSDQGRCYSMRWLPNPVFAGTPRKWTDVHGWPVEAPLVLGGRARENRGFAIGRRNQIVQLFEDPQGKPFTGGGGLTTYSRRTTRSRRTARRSTSATRASRRTSATPSPARAAGRSWPRASTSPRRRCS